MDYYRKWQRDKLNVVEEVRLYNALFPGQSCYSCAFQEKEVGDFIPKIKLQQFSSCMLPNHRRIGNICSTDVNVFLEGIFHSWQADTSVADGERREGDD